MDSQGRWVNEQMLTSKLIRNILFDRKLASPKITLIEDAAKVGYYKKLSKIINIQNKSRMLRLLYGDVYCGERLVRFGMSQNDRCRCCFQKETIYHLLAECSYTCAVYELLGINNRDINEILGVTIKTSAMELRSDILGFLVFRQTLMPPEVLVQTTLERLQMARQQLGEW